MFILFLAILVCGICEAQHTLVLVSNRGAEEQALASRTELRGIFEGKSVHPGRLIRVQSGLIKG